MSDIFISSASCRQDWKERRVSLHRPLRMSLCFRWHSSREWCFRLCLQGRNISRYWVVRRDHALSYYKSKYLIFLFRLLYPTNQCNIHVQGNHKFRENSPLHSHDGSTKERQDSTTQAKDIYKTAGQASYDYLFIQWCFKCSSVLQRIKSLLLLLYYYFFMHNS